MKTIYFALLMAGVVLAACAAPPSDDGSGGIRPTMDRSTSSPPDQPTDAEPNMGESSGLFTVTVSGDVEATFASGGSYTCESGMEVVTTGAVDGNELRFTLPPGTAAGEYTIDGDSGEITAALTVGSAATTGEVFGILTLVAVPAASGDPVSGSFDMTFGNANATGTFDMAAAGVCG